jgi:hypothetical protein
MLDNNSVLSIGTNWNGASWSYNLNDNYKTNLVPVNVHLEHNSVVSMATAPLTTLVPSSVGYMTRNSVNGAEWLWPVLQPHLGWTYTPARADFLQDGTVDVLLQDPARYLYAYSLLGNKAQSPTALVPSQPLPDGWQVVGTGDINVDGQTDLFLNHPNFGLGYWLLDGKACVEAGSVTSLGTPCVLDGTWKVVAVADFNGDGKPDLLLQDDSTYLGIWHLDGAQVVDMKMLSRNYAGGDLNFAAGSAPARVGGKWRVVGTGDFNGDGKPDILFQYDLAGDPINDGQLAVWYMDDFAVIGTTLLDPVRPNDPNDRVVACGDFYRNCALDILFQKKEPRDRWGGILSVWSMDPVNRTHRVKQGTVVLSSASLNALGPR